MAFVVTYSLVSVSEENGLLTDLPVYSSSLPQLDNTDLTPTLPNLLYPQPRLLNHLPQLLWRSLDPIDNPHHRQVSLMTISSIPPIVLRQRLGRGAKLGTAQRRIHDLVADEDA